MPLPSDKDTHKPALQTQYATLKFMIDGNAGNELTETGYWLQVPADDRSCGSLV